MEEHQYQADSDSLSFPDDTVVGIVNDAEAAVAVIEDLVARGTPQEEIEVLYGESGARRLDSSGKRHGILGRLQRLVQHYGDQDRPHVKRQSEELRAGHFLVSVPATEEERDRVARVMLDHGGYFINHYASWAVTRMDD
jgi:hypothetical protein